MTLLGGHDHGLVADKGSINRRKPRICMLTTRSFARNAWRCGFYEGQDVLLEVDDVDLLFLKPGKAYKLRENIQSGLIWHDYTKKVVSINMAYRPIKLTKEYELFIADVPYMRDLTQIPALRGWREHCKIGICWISELWAANVPKLGSWLSALSEFDHIVLGLEGTAKAVSDALKRPCHFLPGGVDAIRFSPYPRAPHRVIDIYSIGPIWEGLHQTFLRLAAKKEIFYVYDTIHASDAQVKNIRQHREMFANMVKRSRYFIVAPAKAHKPEESKDQVEVGFRYFEGSAAGAILLGQVPYCESFKAMFGWPDAVIEIKPDGSDVIDVISSLAAEPERCLAISRRNVKEALLRHDWVYHWKKILDIAGLNPRPALEIRENRLKQMAEQVENEVS
jgi:hypothetical protein